LHEYTKLVFSVSRCVISLFLHVDAGWEDLVDKGDLGGNATKIVELNEHAR